MSPAEEDGAEGLRAGGALDQAGQGVRGHVARQRPVGVEAGLAGRAVEVALVGVAAQVHLQRGGGHELALALGALVGLGPCTG